MKCDRISAVGTPCDLEKGHDGSHSVTYPGLTPRTWSDESDRRFVDRESRKGLGT